MVSHKDQECLAPSWSVGVRDCSGQPTPARSFEGASHLRGSRNPGIRAAWSPSAVHSRHWLSVPARVFVVLSDRMLAAPRPPQSKKSNPDHESRSGSCDRRERLLETAASRNCCKVQAAVGCAVTLQCRMRRLPISITTKTYNQRKPAVIATKKSAATRSSPQVGFSRTIRTLNRRRSFGIRGRPRRDFHRHHSLNPLRCQPMRVSGLTIIKASLQGKNRDHKTKEKRAAAVSLRGGIRCSW